MIEIILDSAEADIALCALTVLLDELSERSVMYDEVSALRDRLEKELNK